MIHMGQGLFKSYDQKSAGQRVLQRIGALLSIMNPEDHLIFFRSVLMADKILTISESIQKQKGEKAKVAFNVGSDHLIMEDLLSAGHSFTRLILASYPIEFLKTVTENIGGVQNLATSRVFTLNPNLTEQDIQNGRDGMVVIKEERIIDQPLLQTLDSRLAA